MKTLIAICMMMTLITASGCWSSTSSQGGIVAADETFSITVPSSSTIKQGEVATVAVTLNRGAAFKQDVQVDIKADGISVTPKYIMVKASEKPEAKVQISVAKDAALGDYIVNVKATPATGKSASTACTVKVVSP
ncbi:MAG TPA: hypothetical protein DCZ94_05630 [Lentisphaeria bacterium]|nr:MAG: hypothetical protein A2X48_07150 [Lentisphaerae bacterium GWF2_49_21]HBC86416.1 hypothetical protein [Lentisphaeria bacterium]